MFKRLSLGVFRASPQARLLSTRSILRNENNVFGELTQGKQSDQVKIEEPTNAEDITPSNDRTLQEYYMEEAKKQQITRDKYVSPLKRALFDLNVSENGFFKNHQVVKDPQSGKNYKLSLTESEIDILEPSIYLESTRIKSSIKKANIVARFIRGYNVKTAINQLHFNPKKMSTEIEKLLKQGLDQSEKLGVNPNGLFVQAIWVGSDGNWRKRVDIKGRGRMGIIEHPYIHVKIILRTDLTKARKRWELNQKKLVAKPTMPLNNEPLNFKVRAYYRW